jgi:hypothetical protein
MRAAARLAGCARLAIASPWVLSMGSNGTGWAGSAGSLPSCVGCAASRSAALAGTARTSNVRMFRPRITTSKPVFGGSTGSG